MGTHDKQVGGELMILALDHKHFEGRYLGADDTGGSGALVREDQSRRPAVLSCLVHKTTTMCCVINDQLESMHLTQWLHELGDHWIFLGWVLNTAYSR